MSDAARRLAADYSGEMCQRDGFDDERCRTIVVVQSAVLTHIRIIEAAMFLAYSMGWTRRDPRVRALLADLKERLAYRDQLGAVYVMLRPRRAR